MSERKIVACWETMQDGLGWRVGQSVHSPEPPPGQVRSAALEKRVSRIEIEREVTIYEHPNERGLATWVTTETLSHPRVLIYVEGDDHPRWSLPLGAVGIEYGEKER